MIYWKIEYYRNIAYFIEYGINERFFMIIFSEDSLSAHIVAVNFWNLAIPLTAMSDLVIKRAESMPHSSARNESILSGFLSTGIWLLRFFP